MTDMELLTEKVNAIAAFMMADTPQEQNEARIMFNETQRRNTSDRNESLDAEGITRKVLLELGAPDHLTGHPYVVEAVVMSLEDRYYINRKRTERRNSRWKCRFTRMRQRSRCPHWN